VLRSALGRLERAQAPLVMLDLLAHAELLANRVAHLVDGAHDRDELRRDVHLGLGLAPLEAVEQRVGLVDGPRARARPGAGQLDRVASARFTSATGRGGTGTARD
jgi:hypothetical protein